MSVGTTFDVIAHIDHLAHKGEDIWEICVNAGMEARNMLDEGKWVVGDIAHTITQRYGARTPRGEGIIDAFARAINIAPDRVREYRTVAKFWKHTDRDNMLSIAVLTYTHLRDAMRFKDIERAKDFLYLVADNGWTVTQARIEMASLLGSTPKRKKVMATSATLLEQTGALLLLQVYPTDETRAIPQLSINTTYDIVMYQSLEN